MDAGAGEAVVPLLVDAIRMLTLAELVDYNGHCSARRDAGSFYIKSGASIRSALTAADIVAIDLDGELCDGAARPPMEFPLHAEIYRARPEVRVVMHTHPKWSTLLTMVGARHQPVFPQGALLGDVPVVDSPLSVNTREMAARVAAASGGRPAVLLVARRRRRRRRHRRVLRARPLPRGERLPAALAMQIGSPFTCSAKPSRRPAGRGWGRRRSSARRGPSPGEARQFGPQRVGSASGPDKVRPLGETRPRFRVDFRHAVCNGADDVQASIGHTGRGPHPDVEPKRQIDGLGRRGQAAHRVAGGQRHLPDAADARQRAEYQAAIAPTSHARAQPPRRATQGAPRDGWAGHDRR